ncbi:MAG: MBOAT family protein [Bacteroidales bacterium]|nr:MBOAT family protein [Bacteroidales bacterium]
MLFNSFSFGFFLVIVYALYWALFNRDIRLRNCFLLMASYFFYGTWNWKLLGLILVISATDFIFGALIAKSEDQRRRKTFLVIPIVINLCILCFFKYFNFFIDSFVTLCAHIGNASVSSFTPLNIILPVGISFYTFQGLSYVIDIYYRRFEPTKDVVSFFTFIAFFPQLIAGPIERARDLLPQFATPKTFDYDTTRKGLFNIACGLFKKIVIADRLAIYVDSVYSNPAGAEGWPAVMAVIFFTFQLYLDFSAYSQIAVGTAQIIGFKLTTNFKRPYTANSFKEFWKRWHITLTRWFGDYLYIPLGGNRKSTFRTYINIMIVFAVSGLWHGASWNFVIWGCLNGLYLVLFDKIIKVPSANNILGKLLAAILVTGAWGISLIFFRAPNFTDAITMFQSLGFGNADILYNFGLNGIEFNFTCWMLAGLMAIEWILDKHQEKIEQFFFNKFAILRWATYLAIIIATIYLGIYGSGNDNSFIYFQF